MPEPLIVNKPFPSCEGLCPDAYSLAIISPAYASPTGELNSVLQYFYHYFSLKKCGKNDIANQIEGIAIAEMSHLKILGEAITALGSTPLFCQNPPTAYNFYSAKYVLYSSNLIHQIEDDIRSEQHAILSYERMLSRLKNEQVFKIVSRIYEDEKLHLDTLKTILCRLKS